MDNCELFISMDCYEGETLKDKICISRLNIDEALDISLKICEGLKKTHQNNIIHRDIILRICVRIEGIKRAIIF